MATPQLDAVVFRMTDAIGEGNFDRAASVLGELFQMQEAAHQASCGLWAGSCGSSTPPGWPSRQGKGAAYVAELWGLKPYPAEQADDRRPGGSP